MQTNRSIGQLPIPLSQIAASSWLKRALIALAGSWIVAASAWIEVPMVPVPMTMQTLAILLIGIACGARLASETVGVYLIQGAVGLPVFAGGAAGIHHLGGPTGGYLIGFLMAAALIGFLADQGWTKGIVKPLLALSIGHIAVFIPGVLWLSGFTGFSGAIATGLTPFILGTGIKTLLALALFKGLVHWLHPKNSAQV